MLTFGPTRVDSMAAATAQAPLSSKWGQSRKKENTSLSFYVLISAEIFHQKNPGGFLDPLESLKIEGGQESM